MPRAKIYRSNAEKQAAYPANAGADVSRYSSGISPTEWETPPELFAELDREFHFTIDVAALPHNAKCERFFTPGQNGLKQKCEGVWWMNPPYGFTLRHWVRKARTDTHLVA